MKVANYSRYLVVLAFATVLVIFLIYLPYNNNNKIGLKFPFIRKDTLFRTNESELTKPEGSHPKILLWAKPFDAFQWTFPQLENGDGGCEIIYDRQQLEKADAVAFFMKTCRPNDRPDPKRRRRDQAYVWWSLESAWTVQNYYHFKLTEYNNFFNWTMVSRTNSDVLAAYWPVPAMDYLLFKIGRTNEMVDKDLARRILPENDFMIQIKELLNRKSKLVAWVASDCSMTPMAKIRKEMVQAISQQGGFAVDQYGKCGVKNLPRQNRKLFQTLAPYKFYMAFENSVHCRDYLTEKSVYNGLTACTIPVIFGPTKNDSKKVMPRGSYIHVEDFDNLTALANYLKYLDKNDTAYLEYFKWWRDPGTATIPRFGFNYGPSYLSQNSSQRHIPDTELQDNFRDFIRFGLYHLCRKLKNGEHINTSKTIPDLAHEWFGTENPRCLHGK